MKNCAYCNKELPKRQRKYCGTPCSERFKKEGPAREQFVYKEVPTETVDVSLLNEGAWMMYQVAQTDEQCIADFMRAWKRAPEHVIFDPKTPFWRYAGPVWDEEEMSRRWQGV